MRSRLVIAAVALLAGLVPPVPSTPAAAREAPHVFVYSADARLPTCVHRAGEEGPD
jgi:hypothetical protein